jgi:hypothetical protein
MRGRRDPRDPVLDGCTEDVEALFERARAVVDARQDV